jgi:hypothetical protein
MRPQKFSHGYAVNTPSFELIDNGNSGFCTGTFTDAAAGAISRIGAVPVFVDVEEQTFNMDVSLAAKALARRPRGPCFAARRPVRRLARHGPICEMARERGIPMIEDAARSIGSEYSEYKGRGRDYVLESVLPGDAPAASERPAASASSPARI